MFVNFRDDDEDENATVNTTKKRKSEVIETSTTKTLFSYFAQKSVIKNDSINRRISGSHFFRAAHLKPAILPM